MFGNIPEMFEYIKKLQEAKNQYMENKIKELDGKCEACQINEIELEYRYPEYSAEMMTENGVKLIIFNHLFCKSCYRKIIETGQLERSYWMEEFDKDFFGEN